MFDVITMGSAVVDVFVKTNIRNKSKICFPLGKKILVDDVEFSTGGGGLNVATGLSKMGMKTAYIGKLGDDLNGKTILKEMQDHRVTFLGKVSKGKTGYSVILDADQERTILLYRGILKDLKLEEIPLNKIHSNWLYLSSSTEETFKTQEKLADIAKKRNIKIAFNPSNYIAEKGPNYLKKILSNTFILILNKEEATLLTKDKNLLLGLSKLGPKIICITNGDKNIDAYDGNKKFILTPHKVKVNEKTGAGDAFATGFLASFIKEDSIELAMKIGNINAENKMSQIGAEKGLLTYQQAKNLLSSKRYDFKEVDI